MFSEITDKQIDSFTKLAISNAPDLIGEKGVG